MTHRRIDDHVHPEYWRADDHHRWEDKVNRELHDLRKEIHIIGTRLTMILGGIALLAFLTPLLSPLLRAWLNIDVPAGQ